MARQLSAAQQQRVSALQRGFGLVRLEANLGDATGRVFDPYKSGDVLVRYISASSAGWPQSVRRAVYNNISYAPNTPVWVGFDDDGELAVLGPRVTEILATGGNPHINDTQNDPTGGFLDLSMAVALRSQPTAAPSLYVTMKSLWYRKDGIPVFFPGDGAINLTSSVPGTAGTQCLALAYLDTRDNTAKVTASTAISAAGGKAAFSEADIEECFADAGDDAITSKLWWLPNGTTVVDDSHDYLDVRFWLNIPSKTRSASIATTDATVTTLVSIAVAEDEVVVLTGKIAAYKSDFSAGAGGTFTATVRRAAGGNVTLIATTSTVQEDSSGSPTWMVDVDTGTQTVRLRWTGVAAENWTPTVEYEVMRVAV